MVPKFIQVFPVNCRNLSIDPEMYYQVIKTIQEFTHDKGNHESYVIMNERGKEVLIPEWGCRRVDQYESTPAEA